MSRRTTTMEQPLVDEDDVELVSKGRHLVDPDGVEWVSKESLHRQGKHRGSKAIGCSLCFPPEPDYFIERQRKELKKRDAKAKKASADRLKKLVPVPSKTSRKLKKDFAPLGAEVRNLARIFAEGRESMNTVLSEMKAVFSASVEHADGKHAKSPVKTCPYCAKTTKKARPRSKR